MLQGSLSVPFLGGGLKNASVDAVRAERGDGGYGTEHFSGRKIRTISVVDGNEFAGAAHFRESGSGLGRTATIRFLADGPSSLSSGR